VSAKRNLLKGRLLLIEDSLELAENLAEILSEANFETEMVHSAEQALSALERKQFDGIVSDLLLPNKNGVELLQTLRERGLSTPVILMSAFADEKAQAAARRFGALALLVKPFDCARLLSLLESGLSLSAEAQASEATQELRVPQNVGAKLAR
jgi:two-component system, OmpR family, response regulator ArlR